MSITFISSTELHQLLIPLSKMVTCLNNHQPSRAHSHWNDLSHLLLDNEARVYYSFTMLFVQTSGEPILQEKNQKAHEVIRSNFDELKKLNEEQKDLESTLEGWMYKRLIQIWIVGNPLTDLFCKTKRPHQSSSDRFIEVFKNYVDRIDRFLEFAACDYTP